MMHKYHIQPAHSTCQWEVYCYRVCYLLITCFCEARIIKEAVPAITGSYADKSMWRFQERTYDRRLLNSLCGIIYYLTQQRMPRKYSPLMQSTHRPLNLSIFYWKKTTGKQVTWSWFCSILNPLSCKWSQEIVFKKLLRKVQRSTVWKIFSSPVCV